MTKKEKILLFLLACINFTHIMDFMIIMPLGSYLIDLFHINPHQFSLIVSSYTLSAGLIGFSASFYVDRFDRKKILLFGYTGFIAGTFACAFAPSYELLIAARIFAGGFGGLIGAQVLSIVGDTFAFERRGKAMGILMTAFSFASAIGVPTGLSLAQIGGWHMPFIVIGSLGLIIIPLVYFYVPSMTSHLQDQQEKPRAFDVLRNIAKDRNQQLGLLLMITLMLAHFSIIPFIAPFLEFNIGFTKNQITLMYFLGGLASMITGPIVGSLSDKYGKFKVFTGFSLLAIIPVLLITNMPPIAYYYVLLVTILFFVLAGGRIIPAQAIITSVVYPKHRGGFMSISSSLQQISIGISAFVAGLIVQETETKTLLNYHYVGYIGIVLTFVCLLITRKVKSVS